MRAKLFKILTFFTFLFIAFNIPKSFSSADVELLKAENGEWQVYPLTTGLIGAGFSSSNLDIIIFKESNTQYHMVKIIFKKVLPAINVNEILISIDNSAFSDLKTYELNSTEIRKDGTIKSLVFYSEPEMTKNIMKGRELFLHIGKISAGNFEASFRVPLIGSFRAISDAGILKDNDVSICKNNSEKQTEKFGSKIDPNSKNYSMAFKIDNIEEYIGREVSFEEKISQVVVANNGNIYLNIGGRYPEQKLSLVIFKKISDKFKNPYVYENKILVIQGKVSSYNGKPQIIINHPWQIKER